MRIDYSDWWNDMVALARANASILFAIAGAFVFLPMLVASAFAVPMEPITQGDAPAEVLQRYSDYYRSNWPPQLLSLILSTIGQLLVLAVLLDARRPSVGAAFRLGAPLFVPLLLANLLINIMVGAGFLFFIVPGLYLIGRLLLTAPTLVAERRANPLTAVGRSWDLTHGQGWRIFFFAFLIFIVAMVLQVAIGGTLGLALSLLPGGGGDGFGPRQLVQGALDAAFGTLYFLLAITLWVALYRRLTGPNAAT